MSKWNERIAAHPVNIAFDNALTALEGLEKSRIELAPEDVQRLLWVLQHVRTRLKQTPAMAVPMQTLDQLNGQIGQVVAELTNFVGNGNVVHLNNAMTSADAILETARVLRPLSAHVKADDVEPDLDRLRNLLTTVVSGANGQVRKISAEAGSRISAMDGEWDSLQQRFAMSTNRLAEMSATIDTQTSRLEGALRSFEVQFTDGEKSRIEAFDLAEKHRRDATVESVRKSEELFDAAADQLKEDAAGALGAIDELKNQAEKLLGAIGVAGVAAGYNETAKLEKSVADKWRIATVVVAVAAAGVLFSALWVDHSDIDSWQRLATRLVLSLSFAGLAAYCGRQSAEHRRVERETRDRQLQLAALNPYLADMPSDKAEKLKEDLAPGYFKPAVGNDPKAPGPDGGITLPVGKVMDLVNALATKGAGGR